MYPPSSSILPPGNCGVHGYHGRTACPKCSTSTLPFTSLIQSPPVSAAVSPADTIRRIEELREKAERRGRIDRSDGDSAYATPGWDDVLFLLAVGERDRRQIARLTEALERIAADEITGTPSDSAIWLARAVLAGEEDARPEMTYEEASEFTFGANGPAGEEDADNG